MGGHVGTARGPQLEDRDTAADTTATSMGKTGDPTVISSTTHTVHNAKAAHRGYKEATGRSSAERSVGNAGSIATGQAQGAAVWADAAWSAVNPFNGAIHQAAGIVALGGLLIGEARRFRMPQRQENIPVPLSCTGHENLIVGDGVWHGTQNAASPPGTSGEPGRGGGGHGTDACDGCDGCDGADIHCTLRSEGQTVSFTATLSGRTRTAARSEREDARAFGSITLHSHEAWRLRRHGGHGAAGDRLRRKRRDRSACTDGGPGGREQRRVGRPRRPWRQRRPNVVEVAPDHAFLLMIVNGLDEPVGWAHGGHGGKKGQNGTPGAGGSGGAGGRAATDDAAAGMAHGALPRRGRQKQSRKSR